MAAGQQLAEIEPGDVLQHPPAGADDLARAVHRAHAHDVVAHGAPGDAARAGQIGRHHAAEGLRSPVAAEQGGEVRRLGDEMLAVFGASAASISVIGVPARARDDQLLRRVERDARRGRAVERRPRRLHRPQHAEFGAVALDQQWLASRGGAPRSRRPRPRRPGGAISLIMHAAERETPCSGLSSQSGSKADLIRRCWSSSTSVNCTRMRSRFSTPTPCSPVRQPPTSTQSCRMSAPNCLGAREAVRVVGVEHDERMQVAVAGMEDVGDLEPVAARSSRRCGAARRAGGWSGWCRPCRGSRG